MDRTYRFRSGIIIFIVLMMAMVFVIRLFTLQLSKAEEGAYGDASTTTYKQVVTAPRGDILDRHGTVLVSNRASYNVTLQNFVLYNSGDPNGYLLLLAETCLKNGIEYDENLPVSLTTPYTYRMDDISASQRYYYKTFLLGREWDADMSAENLMKRLRETYRIPEEYTEYQARLVIGLRYELDLPVYANADTYTVARDITAEQLAILKELGIPGMDVETTTVREVNTSFAAQLIGTVGYMTEAEREKYEPLGYNMNAMVGHDGLEGAFEEYLHGTDGTKVVTVTADGTVVDEYWESEPVSGSNVFTTIDIGLQEAAEAALAESIQSLAARKEEGQDGYDADAGAVVCMKVDTGEVLCAANYPTFDRKLYDELYDELAEDENEPLANRALMYPFAPGSTFKMVTAITAMRHGISPGYVVNGTGVFTKYEKDNYTPKCWIYTQEGLTHGSLTMPQALAQSCNIYFYTMGDIMDTTMGEGNEAIDYLDEVAVSFGFGQHTGSEVYDNPGRMASKALKVELFPDYEYNGWYAADTLSACIGQSETTATPLQLCRYVAAIASQGVLRNATFIRRAISSDYQTVNYKNDFTPAATGLLSEEEFNVLKEGMSLCVSEGTAEKYFQDYPYTVCAKTGTAQHGNGGSDNGAFVCWAPADNPEIAIAVYVEHGASGGYWSEVAQKVMEYYFETKDMAQEVKTENTILVD